MKKNNAKKAPKSRRPLYYVDNPNKSELNWLDDIQKLNAKPISIQGSAVVEQPTMKSQAGSKKGLPSVKPGSSITTTTSPEVIPIDSSYPQEIEPELSEFISSPEETEAIAAIAASPAMTANPSVMEDFPDVIAAVESIQTDNQLSVETLTALLRQNSPVVESDPVIPMEELLGRESRQTKLEEKRMPSRPSPIVYTDDVANEAITGDKLAPYAVKASHLATDSVYTNSLVDFAVTAIKLADGSITSSKIAPESVVGDHLTKNSISGQKIRDRSITGDKLRDEQRFLREACR